MNTKRFIASAVAAVSLSIGLAAAAAATPEDDFWECAAEHQDTDSIGVCCVFYGGTYDDHGQCWDYPGASVVEVDPGPKTRPKHVDVFAEQAKKPRDAPSTQ